MLVEMCNTDAANNSSMELQLQNYVSTLWLKKKKKKRKKPIDVQHSGQFLVWIIKSVLHWSEITCVTEEPLFIFFQMDVTAFKLIIMINVFRSTYFIQQTS